MLLQLVKKIPETEEIEEYKLKPYHHSTADISYYKPSLFISKNYQILKENLNFYLLTISCIYLIE